MSSAYGRRAIPTAMKVKSVSLKKAETDSLPGIQLNDRQMKLYKARKSVGPNGLKEQNHSLVPPPPAKKRSPYLWKKTSSRTQEQRQQQEQQYLGQEPTYTAETVPNTFSEDSASHTSLSSRTSSSSRSRNQAASAFYGQRLDPQERKRYDDLGNTWRDSQSEASSSASAAASSVSAALSAASRQSRSSSKASSTPVSVSSQKSASSISSMSRLRQLQQQRSSGNSKSSSTASNTGSTYSSNSNISSRSAVSAISLRSNGNKSAVSAASSTKFSSASRSVVSSSSRHAAVPIARAVAVQSTAAGKSSGVSAKISTAGSSVSYASKGSRPVLTVATKVQTSASQKKKEQERQGRPSGLGTEQEKSKFLRSTMMQWAKPSSSSSSSSNVVPSALKSTKSSSSTSTKSSRSSRRLSFAPKKSIILTGNNNVHKSPRSIASGGSGNISPKEMAIMRKVAGRNGSKTDSKTKSFSPLNKNPRRVAGKMIRSTSSRMKKLLSSSSSGSFEEDDDQSVRSGTSTVISKPRSLYDDRGNKVTKDTASSIVDDTPVDEKQGRVDARPPIVMEEDLFQDDGDGDDKVMFRNQQMRKKSKRGRSSIFKRRIGHIGMGVMDDLIEQNDDLSSDDSEEDDEESVEEEEEEEEENEGDLVDQYDASIHQARSIKSSTLTPVAKPEPKPIKHTVATRNIDSILEENKDFLKEMREGPLQQALDNKPPAPTMSESLDEEEEEYRTFKNALRAELSGTHSKLYDSFQAMFRCGERGKNEHPPKPLSVYPGTLDLQTKDSISKMSKYLNTEHDVECLISSQIVKDSDVQNYVFSHDSYKESSNKDKRKSITQVPSPHSINGGDDGSQFEVTVSQHSRSVVSSTNDSRYMSASQVKSSSVFKLPPSAVSNSGGTKFNQVKLKPRTDNGKSNNNNETVPSSWTKVRLKPVSKSKTNNARPGNVATAEPPETAEFHRIVLRKTPTNAGASATKKKQFDMELATAPSSLTDASGSEDKPIDLQKNGGAADQPIKLTTPTPAKNCSKDQKKTAEFSPISGTETKPIKLSPMSGTETKPIKLSPMSGTETKPIPVKDDSKGAEENPIKLTTSVGYDEGHPITVVPSKGDECTNPIVMAPSIDLDLNEGSVMIPLENGTSVIVGKDGITEVQSVPGKETTKANVLWRLDRSQVKSALLDMSTFSVSIISFDSSKQGNKNLQFPTSAQCMKFANALHEMKNSESASSGGGGGGGLATINESKAATINDDSSSVYVEQLSDEEQKILDEFRQRKRNPPPPEKKTSDNNDFAKELLSAKLLDMHNGNTDTPKPMSVVNGSAPSSPVSEVSSATSALESSDDSKVVKKYQLMLKMKVPKEVVRGKMEQDGLDPGIIASVLGEEPAAAEASKKISSSGSDLSPEDEKVATVYRKMLKMMIPAEAVTHKMKKDGVSQKIVASVLSSGAGTSNDQQVSPVLPSLSIPEQAAAQKYQKMLKMSVPKEAVEHKMKKDGVDAKVIAFVLGQSSQPPSEPTKPKKKCSTGLTSAEESTAATYRRMIKMNIPKEAVHHKMMKDGVAEKIIAAVLGINKDNGKGKATKGGFKGRGFQWNAIDDDVSIVGSVWSKAKTASEVGVSIPADFDISKHVEEFQKKPETTTAARKSTGKSADGKKEKANLINSNRAQNVAITLKAFNDFTFKELSQNIEFLDPYGKIKGDRALFMKDFLPTAAETKIIKGYTGSDEHLITAEKWFKHIVNVKRVDEKVQVMRTMETFKTDTIMLGKSFELLTDVCNQVMASDRLPDLLDMVRQIGNRMNEGRGDDAAGFKLDFLPRLSQTKGSDKKTTALDLVVLIFCTRNQREALMLSDDYPEIHEASRIQFNDLRSDVRNLEESFDICNTEFEKLQKEHDLSPRGRPPPSSEFSFATPGRKVNSDVVNRTPNKSDSGVSLMDAIKMQNGRVKNESSPSVKQVLTAIQKTNEEQRKSMSPRSALMVSAEKKNQGNAELSLEASIRRLEKFVGEVKYVLLPKLQSQRDTALQACKDLATFFCEHPSENVASNLLKILAGFTTGLNQSVRKHDEQQKILARKEAAMKKRKALESSKVSKKSKSKNPLKKIKKRPSPEASASKISKEDVAEDGEKKSLVLMVNEMLKVAGDKEIDDYVSGNTNATAGSRLEKIYEEEKTRKASEKEDILTAIQRRRSVSTNLVPEQALSDLSATLSQDSSDRRKNRIVNRWSSRRKQDPPTSGSSDSLPPKATPRIAKSPKDTDGASGRRKNRVVSRWSSRTLQADTPKSEALSSVSESTQDLVIEQKRKQSVTNRWASKSPKAEAATTDLNDDESDIGAFQEMIDKRKQKAFNRWASQRI